MQIYILQNSQRRGPFEETEVLEMLKTGQLSANDQAIRQGQGQWQTLGKLFPNVAGSGIDNTAQFSKQAAVSSNRKGCRRIFGIGLLVLGISLFFGDIAALTISLVSPPPLSCELADISTKEFDEAVARNPSDTEDIELKRTSMQSAVNSCGELLEEYRTWRFIFGGLIFFGLVMALAGFFLRR